MKEGSPMERTYSAREVADNTGYHERTVRSWIAAGKLEVIRAAGSRRVLIPARAVRALLAARPSSGG
jgi:excisionase family DNA binding protein